MVLWFIACLCSLVEFKFWIRMMFAILDENLYNFTAVEDGKSDDQLF